MMAAPDHSHAIKQLFVVAIATVNAATVQNVMSIATPIVLGLAFIYIRIDEKSKQSRRDQQKLDDDGRRNKQRLDLEAEITLAKAREEANRDSLTAQLEGMKRQMEAIAAESANNQEKMRKTLHDINDQLNKSKLEASELRGLLDSANRTVIEMGGQLRDAHRAIAELSGVNPAAPGVAVGSPDDPATPPGGHAW